MIRYVRWLPISTRKSSFVGSQQQALDTTQMSQLMSQIHKGAPMKKIVMLLLLVVSALAGCNTMEGVGKDVERGGEKMQDSAKDAKR
jgi:entericidin B